MAFPQAASDPLTQMLSKPVRKSYLDAKGKKVKAQTCLLQLNQLKEHKSNTSHSKHTATENQHQENRMDIQLSPLFL